MIQLLASNLDTTSQYQNECKKMALIEKIGKTILSRFFDCSIIIISELL